MIGGGSGAYPARATTRVEAPVVRAASVPDGFVGVAVAPPARGPVPVRETGHLRRGAVRRGVEAAATSPARARRGRAARPAWTLRDRDPRGDRRRGRASDGLTLAEARAHAAAAGARLPTEDEWQLAAEAGLLERAEPLVWNWTESEHRDGRTRFAILKGGSAWKAEGSDWYVDGGPQEPDFSLQLLLTGPLERSSQIGFRLAVDL